MPRILASGTGMSSEFKTAKTYGRQPVNITNARTIDMLKVYLAKLRPAVPVVESESEYLFLNARGMRIERIGTEVHK